MTIVEVVPLAIEWVASKSCVVAKAYATEVVGHSKAIIDEFGAPLLGAQYKLAHIEALEWELNMRVNFLTTTKAVPVTLRLEALEADNEDTRHAVNLHRLGRLHKLLALIAVPFVFFV